MTKRMAFLVVLCGSFWLSGLAQDSFEDYKRRYASAVSEIQNDYAEYCKAANKEYATFMEQRWEEYRALSGLESMQRPEPPRPLIKDTTGETTIDRMPIDTVISLQKPLGKPTPILPLPLVSPKTDVATATFCFYGTPCRYREVRQGAFVLPTLTEAAVADGWRLLSQEQYQSLTFDALHLRDSLHLCDWGYVLLVGDLAQAVCGEHSSEAVLMQMFILTQSGYKVRIAKSANKLYLLVPSETVIYRYPFITIDNSRYYVVTTKQAASFFVFNYSFPKEQILSVAMDSEPKLVERGLESKHFSSKRYPELQLSVVPNSNLIDFYNQYPLTEQWNLYVKASLSESVLREVKSSFVPVLSGKTEREAVELLLNFVQTAFSYQTDSEQFGYERPFFGDETLFYPYSDCEDRAILFAILVRELTGLEVVLLNYPSHLATAVHFNSEVTGDYLDLDHKRYIVCDPTYINASVGEAMPQFKHSKAKVVRL